MLEKNTHGKKKSLKKKKKRKQEKNQDYKILFSQKHFNMFKIYIIYK